MKLTDIEIGKKYTLTLKGRVTEAIVIAIKPANVDVLWSTSQRDAVLLKLPTGRQIARTPGALTELQNQLDLFQKYEQEVFEEE
jgi:hypothetical protein